MPLKREYNTKARRLIIEFLEKYSDNTVSATDIINYLKKTDITVNKATVYRCLNKLNKEKRLLKFTDEETQKSVYRLINEESDCNEHLHIKCVNCGRLMHLECELMEEIRNHLHNDHGYELKCDGSIIYVVCNKCRNK